MKKAMLTSTKGSTSLRRNSLISFAVKMELLTARREGQRRNCYPFRYGAWRNHHPSRRRYVCAYLHL
jgi:hypothetical protein